MCDKHDVGRKCLIVLLGPYALRGNFSWKKIFIYGCRKSKCRSLKSVPYFKILDINYFVILFIVVGSYQ